MDKIEHVRMLLSTYNQKVLHLGIPTVKYAEVAQEIVALLNAKPNGDVCEGCDIQTAVKAERERIRQLLSDSLDAESGHRIAAIEKVIAALRGKE